MEKILLLIVGLLGFVVTCYSAGLTDHVKCGDIASETSHNLQTGGVWDSDSTQDNKIIPLLKGEFIFPSLKKRDYTFYHFQPIESFHYITERR